MAPVKLSLTSWTPSTASRPFALTPDITSLAASVARFNAPPAEIGKMALDLLGKLADLLTERFQLGALQERPSSIAPGIGCSSGGRILSVGLRRP